MRKKTLLLIAVLTLSLTLCAAGRAIAPAGEAPRLAVPAAPPPALDLSALTEAQRETLAARTGEVAAAMEALVEEYAALGLLRTDAAQALKHMVRCSAARALEEGRIFLAILPPEVG